MTNLLQQAINCDDPDNAAKVTISGALAHPRRGVAHRRKPRQAAGAARFAAVKRGVTRLLRYTHDTFAPSLRAVRNERGRQQMQPSCHGAATVTVSSMIFAWSPSRTRIAV